MISSPPLYSIFLEADALFSESVSDAFLFLLLKGIGCEKKIRIKIQIFI
jgi:hypothetical protein